MTRVGPSDLKWSCGDFTVCEILLNLLVSFFWSEIIHAATIFKYTSETMTRRLQCYGNTVIIYHRIWIYLWKKSFNRLTWLKKLRSHWFKIFSVLLELNIFCWKISTATVSETTTPYPKTNIFWWVLEYWCQQKQEDQS